VNGGLVTVIVPVLDEARELPAALDALAVLPGEWEVVVVDGGSGDDTVAIARAHPRADRVLSQPGGGRARQLNAGAAAAGGDPLVFLHADSRLPPGAYAALTTCRADGGNFTLRFGGTGRPDRFARTLARFYAIQRRHGYYYGDSTLWCRRALFAGLGGFAELPIMDDYDFVRRMERATQTACLPGPATTSDRRWRTQGIARTALSWWVIRWLFVAGIAPDRLARLYRRVR
jgi:rSAM/selenodomain-associated transferase 2